MAVRQFLSNAKRFAVYYPNLRSVSQSLRAFSSGDKRLPVSDQQDVDETTTPNTEETSPIWQDPNLEFLCPKDTRLPLPGNIGLGNQLEIKKVQQSTPAEPDFLNVPLPVERYSSYIKQAIKMEEEENCDESDSEFPDPKHALEFAAHDCPMLVKKEFMDLFTNYDVTSTPLTVLTLSQKTTNNMTEWSEEMDMEREELTITFITVAEKICNKLEEAGFWADFIDPSSGRPYLGPYTNATLFETDERYRHFGFEIEDLGCCKVISHHLWGTHTFAGCVFTNAPVDNPAVQLLLKSQKNNSSKIC